MELTVLNNENSSLCSVCTNVCCENMPGAAVPDDFEDINKEKIRSLLTSGNWSIDWWEDSPNIYYLRPRIKGNKIIDPSFGGECIFLEENGCSLSFNSRPLNCRMLIPDKNGCHYGNKDVNKKYFADQWSEYQDILSELKNEY